MNWLEQARRELAEQRWEPKNPVVPSEVIKMTEVSAVLAVGHSADCKNLPADIDCLSIDEAWEERAAIMQYDGGMDRETAEREAHLLLTVRRSYRGDA